ncbi:STM4012 family radical SAM protein [Dactylosporangium sp. AC04546]|uniref:STM4012 family radical SAM protein n=1 Tax=Dactylosporangium sp. AC04546 TaxID=2862460 RepID=UPI001EDEA0F0|nr:STM4012 family radical SAM protein [Dactylosporangium sp. AC04546]WVK81768.1 STM4012 family radical SAM protein [Dactylosporangium sp. AC04546]
MVALGPPYQGYLYAYPHKTAYRPLRPRPRLADVWAGEPTGALFLYVHVPYCEMRCGFCNLFTRTGAGEDHVAAYLDQLERQAGRVAAALPGDPGFARAAIGGGTPTYLGAHELTRLFDLIERATGADLRAVPLSVETSPATATADRLAVLLERGATRISIGVQSFRDAEAHAAGRPQRREEVDRALDTIRAAGPADLNIDLIYGIPGQTVATWTESLRTALTWRPEELYLYPLYVRPLTGLGRRGPGADPDWDAQRMLLYRHAAGLLADAGYRQLSMRAFRRADAPAADAPDYCCQDDGMVGLGCGARSYTTGLHYSFDYAVSVRQVRGILDDYLRRPPADFDVAEVGFALDATEQRRRWLLKTLLRAEGVEPAGYHARFGTDVDDDFPSLAALRDAGYLAGHRLTAEGLAHSDAIGPWLVSADVRAAMAGHVTR